MDIYLYGAHESNWLMVAKDFGGVVLGALLAYTAASLSERRKEKSIRLVDANILSIKFMNIVDGIFKFDRQMISGMMKAKVAGVDGPVWTMLESISGVRDYSINISADEMRILAAHGEFELIISIFELKDGHNGIVSALGDIYELREKMHNIFPPIALEGSVATYQGDLPPGAFPLLVNLDTLSASLLDSLSGLKGQAREVAPKLHAALKSIVKSSKFPLVTIPEEP